jgi:cell division protein FtsB
MNWRALWTWLQSLGFLVFLAIVAGGAVLVFVPLWHQRHSMQRDIQRLDADLARQEALEKQQKAEIGALKTDPSFVESTARNKLNLARPNETIFRFEPAAVTTSAASATASNSTSRPASR